MTIARTRRGVSLVEVMVTLLVLGAGLVGLARLQTALSASASTSMQRTEASMLAQKKVESYRGFISPAAYDAYFASGTTVTGSETVTGQNASYTVQWTVSDVASASQGRYANIGVTVAWNDAKGEAHVARLQSSFARVPRPVNLAPPASGTSPPASCPGDAAASWTVGTTTCQGVINPGGGPGDTRLVSSTTGTGTNQYVCTADGTWAEVAGYARTCSADCPPGTLAWTGEHGENCSAAIAAGTQGSTLTVTDSLVRITGNAAYTCTNGSWVQGVTSCTATCPTELRSWGTLPQCMDKQLDGTTSPGTSAIIASSGTVTATAIYRCEGNGEWSLQTSVCLDSAAQASCPATVKAWTVGAYTCTAPVPLTDNGGSVTVVKTEGATLGRATFTCADGAWSTATDASCDNNCFVSISGSKTKDVVKITRSSDGGALWADLTCTFGANDKSYVCSSVPVIPDAQYLIRGRNSNGTFTGTVTLSSVGCGRSYTANLP